MQVVGSHDVDTLFGQLLQEVDCGLRGVLGPFLAEFTMGTDNRPRVTEMEFSKSHAEGQRIHQAAHQQQALALVVRQVLVQQQQVVAEVEKGLPGVTISQAAATQMKDVAGRQHHQVIARQANAPTQVNLLHVGKEILVQATNILIQPAAHHQACPRSPKDALRTVVILAVIILDTLKDATAAIGIAMTVNVSARSTGIVKHRWTVQTVVQQFRHYCTHLGVGLHVVQQGVEPAVRSAHVAVQQDRIWVHRLADGQVIPLGKALTPGNSS